MATQLTLNNGVTMPALGFGVYQATPEETVDAVVSALETGYRLIDTAAAYGNEREVGEAVRRSGIPRDEVFIETKVWISDYGYDETLHAFEKSTGKLGVDTLDLLILHQALPARFDLTLCSRGAQPFRSRCARHASRRTSMCSTSSSRPLNSYRSTHSIQTCVAAPHRRPSRSRRSAAPFPRRDRTGSTVLRSPPAVACRGSRRAARAPRR